MDSVKVWTLKELAPIIKCSYNALRNEVAPDPRNPARGTLQMRYAQLPLFRLGGKSWLVRAADVAALINPPAAPAATAADEAPATATRRPGRPRKAVAAQAQAGGAA